MILSSAMPLANYFSFKRHHHRQLGSNDDGNSIIILQVTSSECILSITFSGLTLLQVAELQEMCWPMVLMVILSGCPQLDSIFHAHCMLHSHKIVIPWPIIRNLCKQKRNTKPVSPQNQAALL